MYVPVTKAILAIAAIRVKREFVGVARILPAALQSESLIVDLYLFFFFYLMDNLLCIIELS